ncbi:MULTISPECIES: hypothetical protein [unclassified Streptomyces]|uniref:hypothetical protein n=1 Tax=unclassified Streptomyces TaxID=2593676 RepID=UPI002E324036|nr:hypothetical protein [Streptomyces sp. NBC_01278]
MTKYSQDTEPPADHGPPAAPAPTLASTFVPSAEGGEPACLLHLVCPDCGRLADEPSARSCAHCGGPLPAAGL